MSGSGSSDVRLQSGRSWLNWAKGFGGFAKVFVTGLGGVLGSIFGAFIVLLEAGINVPATFLDAFATGGRRWILAFTRDPADFLGGSFQTAATQLGQAPWNQLGPFLPWLAALSSIGVVAIVGWYLDRRDSDVPGTGVDAPFVSNDEEGQGIDWPIVGGGGGEDEES